jgi:hypothetical protein
MGATSNGYLESRAAMNGDDAAQRSGLPAGTIRY